MHQTMEQKTEEQNAERAESRSAYQKRKRETAKQARRHGQKRVLLFTAVFVILAGVLCGTVIAGTINTPQDTVQIASANAQYVKNTIEDAVEHLSTKLPWHQNTDIPEEPNSEQPTEVIPPKEEYPNEENEVPANPPDVQTGDQTEQSVVEEPDTPLVPPENPYGIDPSKPMVALTFDDGPSKYTWSIVSALQQYGARATFFLVGNRVANHESAIDFLLENHQEVASHSFSHANLVKSTDEEVLAQIQKTDSILHKQHDYTTTLFRVPYGERDERVLEIMRQEGKPVIGWSVDPRDWEVQDKDEIVKHVLSHVKDGDIVLMHDLYKPTVDAVAELVPELQKRGYQLVTVSELFQYKGIALTPGAYYYASWKWLP